MIAVVAAGCTSDKKPDRTPARTVTSTATTTRPAPPDSFTPAPAATVKPLGPGKKAPKGEKNGRCPYIRSGLDEDPTSRPNVADIEGSRVGRTTILTSLEPVGCRFYFSYPDHHAIADIVPRTFASTAAAHNALVLTARAGTNIRSYPDFVRGVDGINYRTKFYGADGASDWAFAFAKGTVLVVVRTDQDDVGTNALYLARAIAAKF